MEVKVKFKREKVGIKEFIKEHKKEIIIAGLAVGTTMAISLILKTGVKPSIKTIEDIVTETAVEVSQGYDIWAMCNGMDEKVVEFAPKLKQFAEENGFSIMCDIM